MRVHEAAVWPGDVGVRHSGGRIPVGEGAERGAGGRVAAHLSWWETEPTREAWLPPGTATAVAGYRIEGGLLYVGASLPAYPGGGPDPALINPGLPVGHRLPSGPGAAPVPGRDMAYDRMSPSARAGYLEWLASGRSDPAVPIGYVALYFYGLERRVVVDCAWPGPARAELPVLRVEIVRLLDIFGSHSGFQSQATALLELIDQLGGVAPTAPPEFTGEAWPPPFALRLGLGQFVLEGTPIPADWALAWAWFNPDGAPRTPAWRCPEQFTRLFALRYPAQCPGLGAAAADSPVVAGEYHPANPALVPVAWQTAVPDVFGHVGERRRLARLVHACCDALADYSHRIAELGGDANAPAANTLAVAALLPPELVGTATDAVGRLRGWLGEQLGADDTAVVDGAELAARWHATPGNTAPDTALSRDETTAFADLLDREGFGIEPDPRFGGHPLTAGPVILFRSSEADDASATDASPVDASTTTDAASDPRSRLVTDIASAPASRPPHSDAYRAAAAMVHLAAAVATADNGSGAEQSYLLDHLQTVFHLSTAEQRRLAAHLRLLLLQPVRLTGLSSRLGTLSRDERTAIAAFCVTVAAADGAVAPGEATVLAKIYGLLGLTEQQLHADIADVAPDSAVAGPVAVRPAQPAPARHAVPAPRTPSDAVPRRLDAALLAAKLAETAKVGALLESIFADEDDDPFEPPPAPATRPAPVPEPTPTRPAGADTLAGLDPAHSALLRDLAARPQWPRADVDALCARHGLLPDGALETLNDAAFDRCDAPLIDGDDPLDLDPDVLQELLT